MESSQPIIVKKIKKGGHGHHGGAWKVAYADFVTAMMAFFLLMWLLAAATPQQQAAVSNYFKNPSAVEGVGGGGSTSMIKLGGTADPRLSAPASQDPQATTLDPGAAAQQAAEVAAENADKRRLESLMEELKAEIEKSQALRPFKDQLLLDITDEGLRIQILDKENRPMFAIGSAELQPYTKAILNEVAHVINAVPNRISISGHTDATPYSSGRDYTNWELSADRANASRRQLLVGGLNAEKMARVVGLADSVLFDQANPRNPINRRISIIVMNKKTEKALRKDDRGNELPTVPAGDAGEAVPGPAMPRPALAPGELPSDMGPQLPQVVERAPASAPEKKTAAPVAPAPVKKQEQRPAVAPEPEPAANVPGLIQPIVIDPINPIPMPIQNP